jgi:predicted transcriptional regulator
MLTVRLDPETEQQLADILTHESDVNRSDLIKRLIRERWLTLRLDSTFVERRGGHPQHLLQDAPPNLSKRAIRKQAISDYLKRNAQISWTTA